MSKGCVNHLIVFSEFINLVHEL
jgi:hypothetical protein